MAAATRILSLNLGSQTVGLAEFHAQPNGGLVLNGYRLREILADPSNEGARNAQIGAALREMLGELGIKGGPVNYAIAAQSVFARFVKLPAVEEEKIERIIAFEAQQNVPFPIDEVVWDYQLVGGGADEQIQVVLVAIKEDLLEEVNAAVESAGLRTSIVCVATMALYNAFRYNYSDLAGCSLLVDIGARTTNLLFIEPGKIFSRSVAIGGGSVSSAIAKEFGEPIAAAEFRKKRDGFVSLGGAYAEPPDPDVARVSKIVRGTMTRLHAEMMRSISHYRAQQQGNAPDRLYLCGGSTSTPYMREFFQEKLQVPVEFFNPLRNVAVSGSGGRGGSRALRASPRRTHGPRAPQRDHLPDGIESAAAKRRPAAGDGTAAPGLRARGGVRRSRAAGLGRLVLARGAGGRSRHGASPGKGRCDAADRNANDPGPERDDGAG